MKNKAHKSFAEKDVREHRIPVDDEKLQAEYENTLGDILENDDTDARDNLADYMNELKEESEALGPGGDA